MSSKIRQLIKTIVPRPIVNSIQNRNKRKALDAWIKAGQPLPTPHVAKQQIINEYKESSGFKTLIETGTYMGDMVEAQKRNFNKIISIELSQDLFEAAKNRFSKDSHVLIMQGDSGKVLKHAVADLKEPAIFWLDGHYSSGITAKGDKDCPIYEELDAIFSTSIRNHILLIDDARCFNGSGDYPSLEALTSFIDSKNPGYKREVKNDIICFAK